MEQRKSLLTYNPFQNLKALLKSRALPLPSVCREVRSAGEEEQSPEAQEKLFFEAMAGVTPISQGNSSETDLADGVKKTPQSAGLQLNEDKETLSRLDALVHLGSGFQIMDTPEYIEGTGYDVDPEVARRLHRGDFSIQGHIDLHRLSAQNAREALERFLQSAVKRGKRGILIIHGRGLSSPSGPILKEKVIEWLTHGRWRKWVVAYASARSCDGGAGATYALLRTRAFSGRSGGRRRKWKWKSNTFAG